MRGALIGAEVTLAVLLLLGAGLTARSLWRLEGEALGFDPDHVTVADLVFQPSDSGGAWLPAYTRALNAVRAIPGVSSAAIGFGVPYGGSGSNGGFLIEGRGISADESKRPWASWAAASDSYFRTLGIPLRRGRAFERSDEDGPGVVIVSEALARTYWPGASPLGARIAVPGFDWRTFTAYRSGQNLWLTVVGVVGDVRDEALGLPPQPTLYLSLAQHPESRAMHLVVRTRLPDPALAASLAQPLRELNPDLPLRLRPMDEMVAGSAATPRLRATLIALFAALALFLASVGIYGLSAYATAQRAVEISVRLALGASPERAARAVARRVGAWAAAGLVSGLLAGAAGARAIRAFLYGIHPADAMTFAVVGIGLGIVALAAAYLPARLAARLDPGLLARSE